MEGLQPIQDDWTTKEKFILACCVSRSGDQNWVSVSRTIKLIMEACSDTTQRPSELCSQKNCAMKYNELLNTASVSKRKSRSALSESVNIETPAEQILRKLTFARIEELDQTIKAERERYRKLKSDINKIQSGRIDDQLPKIWSAIEKGEPIEQLIQESSAAQQHKLSLKISTQVSSSSSSSTLQHTPSRPQRAPKETEKFKSYIEQRQKHNAKYHHHVSTTSSTLSTSPASNLSSVSISPVDITMATTVGPSPAQVQNMTTRVDTTPSRGLLITKPEQQQQQQQLQPQLISPTTPVRKTTDNKESSFLSNLLSSPATEIKAAVQQLTETLKEPIKNVHHVTKESYVAYKKAHASVPNSPNAPVNMVAPTLSKLLEANNAPPATNSTVTKTPQDSKTSPKKSSTDTTTSLVEPVITQSIVTKTAQLSKTAQIPKTVHSPVALPTTTTSHVDVEQVTKPITVKSTPVKSVADKKEQKEVKTLVEKIKSDPQPEVAKQIVPKDGVVTKQTEKNTSKMPKEERNLKTIEKKEEETKTERNSETVPLTIDVADSEIKTDVVCEEPPTKKRAVENVDTSVPLLPSESLESPLMSSPKTKRKWKGRGARLGSRKKTLSGSMKVDLMIEDEAERTDEYDTDITSESKELDLSDDLIDRKLRTPVTPSLSCPASPALSTGSDPETAHQQKAWRKSIMLVWKGAASHKYANVFLHPVTDEEAPGYSSIIYKPMDLSLIKKNIETGAIHTTTEFQRDIMLMFQNALMYNRKEHDVYRMAQEMRDDVMEQIQSFISTQMMVQATDRESKSLRIQSTDVKGLRTKIDAPGHTRQSSKFGFTFLSL